MYKQLTVKMESVKYLETNRSFLRFCGIDPYDYKNWVKNFLYKLWFSFLTLFYTSIIIQAIIEAFSGQFHLTKVCFGVQYGGISLGATFHMVYYYVRREKLLKILEDTNKICIYSSQTGFEEIDMKQRIKQCKVLVWSWATLLCTAGQTMALWPVTTSEKRVLGLPLWYPYNWENSPQYEITLLLQSAMQFFMPISYAAVDILFPCISTLTVGQFQILAHNIRNCVSTALLKFGVPKREVIKFMRNPDYNLGLLSLEHLLSKSLKKDGNFEATLHETISQNIQQHQLLLSFCKDLEDYFSPILLLKVYLCMFYMCLMLFCLIVESDKSFLAAIAAAVSPAAVQIYMHTFFGQIVQTASIELAEKIYESPWYLCPRDFKKSFVFLQMKCKESVKFTAGKITSMNMESCMMLFKAVFSYVAVLQQVTNR